QTQGWVEGRGSPRRAPASFPSLGVGGKGSFFRSQVAVERCSIWCRCAPLAFPSFTRNSVPTPQFFSRFHVKGGEKATATISASHADDSTNRLFAVRAIEVQTVTGASHANDYFPFVDERRHVRADAASASHRRLAEWVRGREYVGGFSLPFSGGGESDVPHEFPGLLIDRDEVCIRGGHVDLSVAQPCPAISRTATKVFAVKRIFVAPQLSSRPRIERD